MPEPFTHAVASFDPTSTAVLLWARLGEGTDAAELVVARDPDLTDVVHRSREQADTERDRTIVADITGLEPATSYWYRFTAGGRHSPVGRTRTLPAGPVDRFRIGTVSCARYSVAPLGVYRALAEREVDLVVHLGDYIYEEGDTGPRPHDPPHDAVTREDYRRRLAQIRSDRDLQALHLRHPVTAVWDDHDLADNAWRTGAKHHDPEEQGPWDERVANAAHARQEWLPMRLADPSDPLVQWRTSTIGDLAELVLLDTRFAGRDQHAGDDGTPDLHDPGRSLLGDAQRDFLRDRLMEAPQPWALVATGVVVNELTLPWPRALSRVNAGVPNGYAVLDGEVFHDDQWDGYPAERDRLATWMDERAADGRRTVVLSGDVHSSWACEGPCRPDDGTTVGIEVTTPAVSSAAMGHAHYPGMSIVLNRAVKEMDHVAWAEVTRRGYAIIDLTPERVQSEWWFVRPYDEDPSATQHLGAALVSVRDAWPPHFVRAEEPTPDPERARLPEPLPPRPDDLAHLRRRRWARLTVEVAVIGVALASALLALVVHRRAPRPS